MQKTTKKRMKNGADWDVIRSDYLSGVSQIELSRRYNISRASIQRKIKAEKWQDILDDVNNLAIARADGIDKIDDAQKIHDAINRAADEKVRVIQRHRAAWPVIKELNNAAVAKHDFEAAKLAKITAETEKIIQEGERKAWGIVDDAKTEIIGGITVTWQA